MTQLLGKVNEVEDADGIKYTAIDFPPEIFDRVKLAQNEILHFSVSDDNQSIIITKTNIIHNVE